MQTLSLIRPGERIEVSPADAVDTLRAVVTQAGPVTWVHAGLDHDTAAVLESLGFHEVTVKSLVGGPERPRAEEFADHLYLSLFTAGGEEGSDEAVDPSGVLRAYDLRIFLGPTWVVSLGRIDRAQYEGLAERVQRQVFGRSRGASYIVYHLCEWAVETLYPVVEQIDDRVDNLEDMVVLSPSDEPMPELFRLKRDIVESRRRVAPLRDVMQRLGTYGVSYVEPGAEVYFRDVHDDVLRVIELLDTYRDVLSSALDLHLSNVSNRLNRVMKQLTVVATVFMPLSFLAGLFGTNFLQMPFDNDVWFAGMFVLMALSVVGMVVWMRWRIRG